VRLALYAWAPLLWLAMLNAAGSWAEAAQEPNLLFLDGAWLDALMYILLAASAASGAAGLAVGSDRFIRRRVARLDKEARTAELARKERLARRKLRELAPDLVLLYRICPDAREPFVLFARAEDLLRRDPAAALHAATRAQRQAETALREHAPSAEAEGPCRRPPGSGGAAAPDPETR
jgi:hypothetical protein